MSNTDVHENGDQTVDHAVPSASILPPTSDISEIANIDGNLNNFPISKKTKKFLNANGIEHLFPVQTKTFQSILDGKHVIVKSSTGSGKTFAFLLPMVEKFLKDKEGVLESARVLILAPTRELAIQTTDCVSKLTNKLKAVAIYGGARIEKQLQQIEQADVKFLVCTPGRILDMIENHRNDMLNDVKFVVLDECDRMLDMGFLPDVTKILSGMYAEGNDAPQTMIFSATIPKDVKRVIKKFVPLEKFEVFDLIEENGVKTSESVQHLAMEVVGKQKADLIARILQVYCGNHKQAIIFCPTKREADTLSTCSEIKLDTHVLHGDIPQDKREMIMASFRKGKYRVLVTTDVAARGLDIPEVDLVVICGPPQNTDDYIHRSGRTGRAGRAGTCILLFSNSQLGELKYLEQKTGVTFKRVVPPHGDKILEASADDALKSLNAVPEDVRNQFLDKVEAVLKSMDAKDALAAALAQISGYNKVGSGKQGMLSGVEDKTTYQMNLAHEIRGCGILFSRMRAMVGEEVNLDHAFGKILFTQDGKNVYFELDSKFDDTIQSKWTDSPTMQLSLATEIPENLISLKELRLVLGEEPGDGARRSFQRPQNGGFNGYNNDRGGFGGRGGRGSFRGRGDGRRGDSRGRFGGNRGGGFGGPNRFDSPRKRFQNGNGDISNGDIKVNKVIKLEDGASD